MDEVDLWSVFMRKIRDSQFQTIGGVDPRVLVPNQYVARIASRGNRGKTHPPAESGKKADKPFNIDGCS